mmetsp:Transcript_112696/g.224172  ORF Transcript_112696/g.224172 Transcript_112696/m.224172 type:complete len:175 (+) Transcript_112696:49-573(+)
MCRPVLLAMVVAAQTRSAGRRRSAVKGAATVLATLTVFAMTGHRLSSLIVCGRHLAGQRPWESSASLKATESQVDAEVPRQYFKEMRNTDAGNAFWRRRTDDKWGEFAEGNPGKFDKDDLVEAVYDDTGTSYCAQVVRYVGNDDWLVLWVDDLPEESAQASVVATADMKHISIR